MPHLAIVDHLSPAVILSFQPVLETHLFWSDKAESDIVDLEIASERRQAIIGRCCARPSSSLFGSIPDRIG